MSKTKKVLKKFIEKKNKNRLLKQLSSDALIDELLSRAENMRQMNKKFNLSEAQNNFNKRMRSREVKATLAIEFNRQPMQALPYPKQENIPRFKERAGLKSFNRNQQLKLGHE